MPKTSTCSVSPSIMAENSPESMSEEAVAARDARKEQLAKLAALGLHRTSV